MCTMYAHFLLFLFLFIFALLWNPLFFAVLRKTIKNFTLIYSIPYELTTISGVWTHFVLTLFVLIYSTNFI